MRSFVTKHSSFENVIPSYHCFTKRTPVLALCIRVRTWYPGAWYVLRRTSLYVVSRGDVVIDGSSDGSSHQQPQVKHIESALWPSSSSSSWLITSWNILSCGLIFVSR